MNVRLTSRVVPGRTVMYSGVTRVRCETGKEWLLYLTAPHVNPSWIAYEPVKDYSEIALDEDGAVT